MILIALMAALTAIGAFIRIPIPYVPFTMQFLFANMAGILLGKNKGAMAVALYVFIGLIGVPVFTKGGGLQYIYQPSFGYLVAFIIGAYVAGWMVERCGDESMKTYLFASITNLAIVYFLGASYLALIMNVYLGIGWSFKKVLIYGCLIFIPGDLLGCVVGSYVTKRLKKAKIV